MRNGKLISRAFWAFFLASVLSTVIVNLNSIAAGIIVGHLIGPDAVSTVNLGVPILNFIMIPPLFIVLGANLVASTEMGRRNHDEVKRLFTASAFGSVALAVLLALALIPAGDLVAGLLTKEERLLPLLKDYLPAAAFSCVATVAFMSFSTFAKVVGKPGLVVRCSLVELAVNTLSVFVFVGCFGWGMRGVAAAMLLGGLAAILPLLPLLRTDAATIGFTRLDGGMFLKRFGECLRVGIPLEIGTFALAIVILALNGFAQRIGGADAVFIVSITLQLMMLGMLVFQGADGAIINIGGALWGENDITGYRLLLRGVLNVLFLTQISAIVLVLVFAPQIASLFGAGPELAETAVLPLRQTCLLLLPMCLLMILVGIFTLEGHALAALVLQVGIFAFMLGPSWLATVFRPGFFWASLPCGLWLLLALVCVWTVFESRRNGRCSWFTLAPLKSDAPEFGFSAKGADGAANIMSGVDEFIAGRGLKEKVATFREGVRELLDRTLKSAVRCDVRIVDQSADGNLQLTAYLKSDGVESDPRTPGREYAGLDVQYAFQNRLNNTSCRWRMSPAEAEI